MIFDIFCLYLVTGPYHIQQPKIPSTVLSIIQVFFHHLPSLHGAARWHGVVWVGWPVQKIRVEVLGSYHCFKRFRMLAHGFIVWFHIASEALLMKMKLLPDLNLVSRFRELMHLAGALSWMAYQQLSKVSNGQLIAAKHPASGTPLPGQVTRDQIVRDYLVRCEITFNWFNMCLPRPEKPECSTASMQRSGFWLSSCLRALSHTILRWVPANTKSNKTRPRSQHYVIVVCLQDGDHSTENVDTKSVVVNVWIEWLLYMGVDQNKRAWERYNRRSTANQSRTHRWQSRRDFVLSNVICTENEIDISIYTEIYTSHNLEEIGKRHGMAMGQWLHLGDPQSPHNRGSIADLSITNMETISTKRLTLQMLCLSWEVI